VKRGEPPLVEGQDGPGPGGAAARAVGTKGGTVDEPTSFFKPVGIASSHPSLHLRTYRRNPELDWVG